MAKINENIDAFITDLLHINDVDNNKLMDLYAGDLTKTYFISHPVKENLSKYVLEIISARIGKVGNTILSKSSLARQSEQILGKEINDLAWRDANGNSDPSILHKHVESVYKELDLKGNNPLFLSVGAITWRVAYKDNSVKEVVSPLLLFPIRLIRSASPTTPIYVEFINDDIYINPCFLASLRLIAGDKIVDEFPHPNAQGFDVDFPIDISKLGDGERYFDLVSAYVNSQCRQDISDETVFKFDKNVIALSQYNHSELCMYYDIKRNKEKIYNHPLINRIFAKGEPYEQIDYSKVVPQFILPRDSVQERITKRVLAGQSLIVKGPPGTGKTVTITNLIASLLAQNKKVLLSSQKTAAMFEVFAKLPEPIRKFVMLLDSETEAQAAKLNVVDVKKEFNQLLQEKRGFSFSAQKYDEYDHGNVEVATAVSTINAYQKLMFEDKDVGGMDYYSALDNVCNYDIEPVLFTEPKNAYCLTSEQISLLADLVEDAGEWFNKVASGHAFIKSPWYPIAADLEGIDSEKVVLKNKEIAVCTQNLIDSCAKSLASITDKYNQIPLVVLESVLSSLVSAEQIESVLKIENSEAVDLLSSAYQAFLKTKNPSVDLPNPSVHAVEKYLDLLGKSRIDANMKKSEFLTFNENFKIIELLKDSARLKILKDAIEGIASLKDKREQALSEFYSIFSSDISSENLRIVEDGYEKLCAYIDKEDCTAPKAFDFKSKKIYAQLKSLGYGREIPFNQVVKGASLYHSAKSFEVAEEDIKIKISSQFKLKLSDQQISILFDFAKISENAGLDVGTFVKDFEACKEVVLGAINECVTEKDYTLADLLKTYHKAKALDQLNEMVNRFSAITGILISADTQEFAKQIFIAKEIVNCKVLGCCATEIADNCTKIYKNCYELKGLIKKIVTLLEEFEQNCYANFYTVKAKKCTIEELEIFVKEGQDRNVFNAVSEYLNIVKSSGQTFSLERFFRPFETGLREKGKYSFKEILIFSLNWLAVEYKKHCMGALRNGLGDKITHELEDWKGGIAQMDKATLSIIEGQCMSRINANDPDFAFLTAERSSGETLRRFFKQYAKAILKLKKCFILSPSTASVFFTKEEFADFDIVIIDEASQLEPTAILPVLFRAKQVILVGDEWQMPPIKHFSSRVEKKVVDEEGEVRVLGPNTSVLSLALENCAFPVEQLVCHYRSKTEALIAFSQDRFYPNMRTFPARVPKAEGLGFKDVFVADGRCEGGVNEQEAVAVVKQLKEHFEKYYDAEKRSLNGHSVGVVAFGKEQKDKIESLAFKDKELAQKINSAIANFDDVAEKLIFFKTIETVQGQEAEHLILSITYGKGKTGQVMQSFGELNRGFNEDKLGQCIFNVAVTRAKSSVTVVHSILAEEITLESVAFIGKYLSTVEKFSQDGKGQWIGKNIDQTSGFIRQVADFIVSQGISADRIVIDCGVNKGSVKIPIVVLSKDMSQAELGIWCEKPLAVGANYFDDNVRYVQSLIDRGWILHKIFIHEWVDNNLAEKQALEKIINKYITK